MRHEPFTAGEADEKWRAVDIATLQDSPDRDLLGPEGDNLRLPMPLEEYIDVGSGGEVSKTVRQEHKKQKFSAENEHEANEWATSDHASVTQNEFFNAVTGSCLKARLGPASCNSKSTGAFAALPPSCRPASAAPKQGDAPAAEEEEDLGQPAPGKKHILDIATTRASIQGHIVDLVAAAEKVCKDSLDNSKKIMSEMSARVDEIVVLNSYKVILQNRSDLLEMVTVGLDPPENLAGSKDKQADGKSKEASDNGPNSEANDPLDMAIEGSALCRALEIVKDSLSSSAMISSFLEVSADTERVQAQIRRLVSQKEPLPMEETDHLCTLGTVQWLCGPVAELSEEDSFKAFKAEASACVKRITALAQTVDKASFSIIRGTKIKTHLTNVSSLPKTF